MTLKSTLRLSLTVISSASITFRSFENTRFIVFTIFYTFSSKIRNPLLRFISISFESTFTPLSRCLTTVPFNSNFKFFPFFTYFNFCIYLNCLNNYFNFFHLKYFSANEPENLLSYFRNNYVFFEIHN